MTFSLRQVAQLLLLCNLWSVTQTAKSKANPNNVVVIVDDLGWYDVGWNSPKFNATPNLTKLAKQGVILDRYYVQPLCTPTRTALLTGRYPIHNGMQRSVILPATTYGLPLTEKLLPQYLKEQGYATHMVGKWHAGSFARDYLPTRRGFDTFYGSYEASGDFWDHSLNATLGQEKVRFEGFDLHQNEKPVYNKSGIHSTDLITQKAIEQIWNHTKYSNKPLFLYVAYQAPHSSPIGVDNPEQAIQVPEEYVQRHQWIANSKRRQSVAMINHLDHGVGQIYEALMKSGLMSNTVLIFSSDNGGSPAPLKQTLSGPNFSYNWPLRGQKHSLWEGGVHVPGFVHSPLLSNPGHRYNHLVHVTDWLPTIVHLACGSATAANLDGHNVWESMNKGLASARKEILLNINSGKSTMHMTATDAIQAAMISGSWKIIKGEGENTAPWLAPPEVKVQDIHSSIRCADSSPRVASSCLRKACLFDLAHDPCETNDVSSQQPQLVRQLMEKLNVYHKSMVAPLFNTTYDKSANPLGGNMFWEPWIKL